MKTFTLTYTQCKDIEENGLNLRDVVDSLNDQPEWLRSMGGVENIAELAAIQEGGCASGAYMPAITYHTADGVMAQYGDDVLKYIKSILGGMPRDWLSWGDIHYLSLAVELWCMGQIEISELNIEY